MVMETKQEVFERVMAMEKPHCPYCKQEMSIWDVPPVNFGDGLGWGAPYLFVCFNDECSVYVEGWASMDANYSQKASYRCFCYPDNTSDFQFMPVFSNVGGKGQVIDDEVLAAEQALKDNIKKGFSILAQCYVSKDSPTAVSILSDPCQPVRVRLKAAEMAGDIGEIESIETLRNFNSGNKILDDKVAESVAKIHEKFFTRECPFCAEIIKKRASICKHCKMDVS